MEKKKYCSVDNVSSSKNNYQLIAPNQGGTHDPKTEQNAPVALACMGLHKYYV